MVVLSSLLCWCGSYFFMAAGWINQLPSTFAVHKGDKEPIIVTLPREIQGKSELLVFLEPHPVKSKNSNLFTLVLSCVHMLDISKAQQRSFIGYLDDLHGKHLALPPWEQKLKAAQKVIFNHELFSQVNVMFGRILWHNFCVCSYLVMPIIKRLHFHMKY